MPSRGRRSPWRCAGRLRSTPRCRSPPTTTAGPWRRTTETRSPGPGWPTRTRPPWRRSPRSRRARRPPATAATRRTRSRPASPAGPVARRATGCGSSRATWPATTRGGSRRRGPRTRASPRIGMPTRSRPRRRRSRSPGRLSTAWVPGRPTSTSGRWCSAPSPCAPTHCPGSARSTCWSAPRWVARATLYDSSGRVVATAQHTWIAVDPAAFG